MKNKPLKLSLKELPVFQNAIYWFILPTLILLIALICGTVYQFSPKYSGFANVGIDFTGGTVLTVEGKGFDIVGSEYEESLAIIRQVVESKGARISISQTGGSDSIIVRYKNEIIVDGIPVDYNVSSKTEEMIAINDSIKNDTEAAFRAKYADRSITISADAEMTNATASKELINKALLSVGIALLLMLIYIIIRFDLFSGISAIVAEFHDILILFSFLIIFRVQMNSSLIAGIITVISYCINNTIVIFDRVRENMQPYKQNRARIDTKAIVNMSVTSSLKRTLFSSFTTLLMIVILALSGIQSLTEFALPIIFGLFAGLYSSNFVAPSVWGLLMQRKLNGARKARKAKAVKAYN
jgi:preprotein translocase subunit SecF